MKWYIFLQEPERALEIYEEARKRNPRDTQLAAKMGQALQKTHQYGKAINYYREAVKNEDHGSLRFDLAELLVNYSEFLNTYITTTYSWFSTISFNLFYFFLL